MNILALDLGTKTGWAQRRDGVTSSGTWLLATEAERLEDKEGGLDRRGDRRFFELLRRVEGAIEPEPRPDVVIFEDVRFSTFTMQTQLWSALRCAVWAVCRSRSIPVEVVDVPVLKKFGANHGGATKEMMAAWLVKKHPDLYCKTARKTKTCFCETVDGRRMGDDEVDALHMIDYLDSLYGKK